MRAKKSLGQHFLKSKVVVNTILQAAAINETDTVLEIGPGKGALTKPLCAKANRVIAIEKDAQLIEHLQRTLDEPITSGKLQLLSGDVLTTEFFDTLPETYKLVANIPYYITGAILRHFLEAPNQPSSMTFLVQKEVAERIVARDGKESLLSISVKAYGTPRYVKSVPAKFFSPAPKVDSAVLHIDNLSRNNFTDVSEENFFTLLHTGFAHRRKMLRNNLTEAGYESVSQTVLTCNLTPTIRAEELSVDDWLCLTNHLV